MEAQKAYVEKYFTSGKNIPQETIEALMADEQELVVSTGVTLEDGSRQTLTVDVVRNPEAKGTIVQFGGFGHNIGNLPSDTAFRASIAARTKNNVLTVGLPGVADPEHRRYVGNMRDALSRKQAWGLFLGDARLVGEAIAEGIAQAVHRIDTDDGNAKPVTVLAPSLTTMIAPALAKPLLDKGVNLQGIGLIEPVGLTDERGKHSNPLTLLWHFARSARLNDVYLDSNPAAFREAQGREKGTLSAGQVVKGLGRSALYGLGIGRGRTIEPLLEEDVAAAMRNAGVQVLFAGAGLSEFHTRDKIDGTLERLRRADCLGIQATSLYFDDATHSTAASSDAFAQVAQALERQ